MDIAGESNHTGVVRSTNYFSIASERPQDMATFFSDVFGVDEVDVENYGAFNVSLINDLPLFVDPFLLFNSRRKEYTDLHDHIISYLEFLTSKASIANKNRGLLIGWYYFSEIKQNWLGFSLSGNSGSGPGMEFAKRLCENLEKVFPDFGKEKITESSHLEKLCLIAPKIGRDNVSDFTTNLILDFICNYTQEFARSYLRPEQCKQVSIKRAAFNYKTEIWEARSYQLPWYQDDFVLLTPTDILTKDDTWINKGDMLAKFQQIPNAITNEQLRAQVSNYFVKALVTRNNERPSKKEQDNAALAVLQKFPIIADYYIWLKEQAGDEAEKLSAQKVSFAKFFFNRQLKELQGQLSQTAFYGTGYSTYEETHERLAFLKDVIENKGGHKIFHQNGKPIRKEKDLQILCRLVWFGTPSDVGSEVNDGRGPVDFKISRGAKDKTLIEMKLASNTQLERNLKNQVKIYQAASDADKAIKAILYFTLEELIRVRGILRRLDLADSKDIVLIDARNDNKPSGSIA